MARDRKTRSINCPSCGKPMKKHPKKAEYACRNPRCPVIFVRIHHGTKHVVRDARAPFGVYPAFLRNKEKPQKSLTSFNNSLVNVISECSCTMAEMGIRAKMFVKDVMSSPTITIDEEASVHRVAQRMEKYKVGGIIVTGKQGKPLGIITERDLIIRVLAKSSRPSKLNAKQVMTSPLITVNPDETLSEAARRMSRLNIRRLGVMYKGNLVGVITSRDILAITPELLEIMQEHVRIQEETEVEESPEHPPLAGYCDQCRGWSDTLEEVEGSFLCEECKAEL